jgi:WD40 repeat protein
MGYVECVAWSPCERRVLSGNDDHTVRLWDIKAGHCVRLFEGHTGIVTSVAWSADRQRAISGGSDYTVRLWM